MIVHVTGNIFKAVPCLRLWGRGAGAEVRGAWHRDSGIEAFEIRVDAALTLGIINKQRNGCKKCKQMLCVQPTSPTCSPKVCEWKAPRRTDEIHENETVEE